MELNLALFVRTVSIHILNFNCLRHIPDNIDNAIEILALKHLDELTGHELLKFDIHLCF